MNETPNFIYLNQLSDGDDDIKNKLLVVLKEEFVSEFKEYNTNMINKDLLSASEKVHKLRHKIGFFGMEKAYELSNEYEQNLINNSDILKTEFEETLSIIYKFITIQ